MTTLIFDLIWGNHFYAYPPEVFDLMGVTALYVGRGQTTILACPVMNLIRAD